MPDLVARFTARKHALIALLRDLPKPLVAGFPVSVAEVQETIDAIDARAAIASFASELAGNAAAAAIKYEWYYDGTDPAEYGDGYTYATCKNPFAYSETDLVKVGKRLGVESDVELEDHLDEVGGIEIGLVLRAQHELCAKVDEHYLHIEAETRVPAMTREQRVALPVLEDAYRNLFDLKLYELLHAACAQVADRPDYVFVGSHERWPILVGTPATRPKTKTKTKTKPKTKTKTKTKTRR